MHHVVLVLCVLKFGSNRFEALCPVVETTPLGLQAESPKLQAHIVSKMFHLDPGHCKQDEGTTSQIAQTFGSLSQSNWHSKRCIMPVFLFTVSMNQDLCLVLGFRLQVENFCWLYKVGGFSQIERLTLQQRGTCVLFILSLSLFFSATMVV